MLGGSNNTGSEKSGEDEENTHGVVLGDAAQAADTEGNENEDDEEKTTGSSVISHCQLCSKGVAVRARAIATCINVMLLFLRALPISGTVSCARIMTDVRL